MAYIKTDEDFEIARQTVVNTYVKVEIYNFENKLLNVLNGLVDGGSVSIQGDSKVRRTFSCTIVPTDEQSIDIAEDSVLWINKKIKVFIGFQTPTMSKMKWYPQGVYMLTETSTSYDSTNNQLEINCSDLMISLDGSVDGEMAGQLDLTIPAYEEVYNTNWTDTYGSFDAAWTAKHSDSVIFNNDTIKSYVSTLIDSYDSFTEVQKQTYIDLIQTECDKSGLIYKIEFGNSDDDQIIILARNIIKAMIKTLITTYTNIDDYIIEDVGEYKGTEAYKYYAQYRDENNTWDCMPYDQEYSTGATVADAIETFCTFYSGYDFAFDEEGIFQVKMIPTLYEDNVVLTNSELEQLLVAEDTESTTTDLTTIKNICEVWGQSFESDFYSEDCTLTDDTYAVSITSYTEYKSGDVISIVFGSTNPDEAKININSLGAYNLYDEYSDKLIEAGTIQAGQTYTIKYKKIYANKTTTHKFYFLGQYQVHGLAVLSDGTTIEDGSTFTVDGETVTCDTYSEEYFKYKYNCKSVKLDIIEDSPYTVQAIGERRKVYSGDDYESITSDSTAVETAAYELWKNCRLTDNITIKTTLIPWLHEYEKISYKKANSDEVKQYITHNITHDFTDDITTIEMYSFYPLYQSLTGDYTELALSKDNLYYLGSGVSTTGSLTIPETVLYNGVEYQITSIADNGFSDCKYLKSVELPDTIKKIGKNAFSGCTTLSKINFPNSLEEICYYAFGRCMALTSVSFPNSLVTIGEGAFYGCGNLTTVDWGRGVQTIGAKAFYQTKLSKIDIVGNIKTIGDYAFYKQQNNTTTATAYVYITLEYGVQTIGKYAFAGTYERIVICPTTITSFGENCFNACKEFVYYTGTADASNCGATVQNTTNVTLTAANRRYYVDDYYLRNKIKDNVEISNSVVIGSLILHVTKIATDAFQAETYLTGITLPSCLEEIEDWAFMECTNLKFVTWWKAPKNIVKFGEGVFSDCIKLTSVILPDGITSIPDNMFNGCFSLQFAPIKDTVTEIGDYAYFSCSAIKTITFPTGLVSIGEDAFAGCKKLQIDSFPSTLTTIGDSAFLSCSSLETITMPKTVTSLGARVFRNSSLTSIIVEDGTTTIPDYAYYEAMNKPFCVIYVPDSVTSIGKSAFEGIAILAYNGDLEPESGDTNWGAEEWDSYDEDTMRVVININNKTKFNWMGKALPSSGVCTIPYEFSYVNKFRVSGVTYLPATPSDNTVITVITALVFSEGILSANLTLSSSWSALTSITIPSTMVGITSTSSSYLCNGVSNLTEFIVSENNPRYISLDNGSLADSYKTEDGIKYYTLLRVPPATTGAYTVPHNVLNLSTNAFKNCTKITSIALHSTFEDTNIDGSVFLHCAKLTSFTVDSGNTELCADNDILFNADKTTLFAFPRAKSGDPNYIVPDTVTTISTYAFHMQGNIVTINLPSSVTSIEDYAFKGMTKLVGFDFGKSNPTLGNYCFSMCYKLENVVFPTAIATIPKYMFYSCTLLSSFGEDKTKVLPSTITGIGNYAFYKCIELTGMQVPESITSIGSNAFYNIPTVVMLCDESDAPSGSPWGAKAITYGSSWDNQEAGLYDSDHNLLVAWDALTLEENDDGMGVDLSTNTEGTILIVGNTYGTDNNTFDTFTGYTESTSLITEVVFNEGITGLGDKAFRGCTSLTKITLPESLTTIGTSAFYRSGIQSIDIPSGVSSLPAYAFYECTNLDTVNFKYSQDKNGVKTIGDYAFYSCTNLTDIQSTDIDSNESEDGVLPYYLEKIGACAFRRCKSIDVCGLTLCDRVTSIGIFAFTNSSLTVLTIPNSVTYIASYMCDSCGSLKTVVFESGSNLTCLNSHVFADCTSLAAVTLPDSLTYIQDGAFSGCTALTNLEVPSTVTTIDTNAFAGVPLVTYSGSATGSPWGADEVTTGTTTDTSETTE